MRRKTAEIYLDSLSTLYQGLKLMCKYNLKLSTVNHWYNFTRWLTRRVNIAELIRRKMSLQAARCPHP